MAKININEIEGYQNMSTEEKLAALEAFDLPEPDYTGYVKKDLLDKATSEAAKYKKDLRERMSEDEAAKVRNDEEMSAIKAELEQLKAEKAINANAAKFMELGYDSKLATETATAMAAGEMDTVFKNHGKFLAEREKALKTELMKDTPAPPAGDGGKATNKADFQKMSLIEKQKFAKENPEAYKEFYTNKEE